MKDIEGKEGSSPEGLRSRFQKHGPLWAGVLWAVMVLLFVLNWKSLNTFLNPKEELPPEPFGDIGLPIYGEREASQVMLGKRGSAREAVKYTMQGESGAEVEVGVVRVDNRHSVEGDYVLRVYELTGKKKRKLLERTGDFPINSWMLFRTDEKPEGLDDGATEILYVLKPKGIRGKIASLIGRAKGEDYLKDFAFLAPNVLNRRKLGERNVILLSFDTLRADHLSADGYTRPTSPNLDLFARRGVLFTQAITSAPWTIPAHYSLFTGLYPSAYSSGPGGLCYTCYADKVMADIMKENGYYTIGITAGAAIAHAFGFNHGFNRYLEFNSLGNASNPNLPWKHEDGTRKIFQSAMNWLEDNHDIKFFMFIHNYECHDPYEDTRFMEQANNGSFIEQRKALYDGDIRRADDFFGRLVEQLNSLDLLSNTIVVVMSDHGEDFYDHFSEEDKIRRKFNEKVPQISTVDHGHSVYDEIINVPVIFYRPGLQPKRSVIENQVRVIDVMPTILDYLGISYDGPLQGISLRGLIETGERSADPPVLSEFTEFGPEQKSVRMNGYKYIYTANPAKNAVYPNIPRYALFDLRKDPEEKNNIYAQNKDLAEKYHKILEETEEESRAIRNGFLQGAQPAEKEKAAELPQDVVDSLKALGYIQ